MAEPGPYESALLLAIDAFEAHIDDLLPEKTAERVDLPSAILGPHEAFQARPSRLDVNNSKKLLSWYHPYPEALKIFYGRAGVATPSREGCVGDPDPVELRYNIDSDGSITKITMIFNPGMFVLPGDDGKLWTHKGPEYYSDMEINKRGNTILDIDGEGKGRFMVSGERSGWVTNTKIFLSMWTSGLSNIRTSSKPSNFPL